MRAYIPSPSPLGFPQAHGVGAANVEEAVITEVLRFDIEGQPVVCYQTGGDRLWHCECAYFQRTLKQYQEGFCPHTAVAIMRFFEGERGDGSE